MEYETKFLKDNGLTIVLLLATAATVSGMALSRLSVHNEELAQHQRPAIDMLTYIGSGHFLSALFENRESELLQMSAYVAGA